MTFWQRFLPGEISTPARFAWLGVLALVVPALLYGPWIPFLDLVAFVGMDSFPAKLSAGPLHFAVLQFSYVGHYILSRLLLDIGLSPAAQVVVIYLLQALLLFGVIQSLLRRFLSNGWLCSMAIAAGVLAFWDALFVWGGPLAFSLAALSLAIGTTLTFAEIDAPRESTRLVVALLIMFSMVCHPFAFPFACLLVALRLAFLPTARVHTIAIGVLLIVFAWIIRQDSVESPGSLRLTQFFTFSPTIMARRFVELFTLDAYGIRFLFGYTPRPLHGYYLFLAVLHALAFFTAPVVAWKAREAPALRAFAALLTAVGLLYFVSVDETVVPQWPQRILTFYSPFTYVGGIVLPWYLICRWRPVAEARLAALPRLTWIAPAALLGIVVWIQVPILQFGRHIERNYIGLRDAILRSGLSNAFLVASNLDSLSPFYLRSIPFLLFSDAELVRRNLIFFTEWHDQARHPSRLLEFWFDVGRPRYQAIFSCTNQTLSISFETVPADTAISPVRTNETNRGKPEYRAISQSAIGHNLLDIGATRDAAQHFQAAANLAPSNADIRNNLSVALMRLGKHAEALQQVEEAIRLDPRSAVAHSNRGALLVMLGKPEEGLRATQSAIDLQPNAPLWHVNMGRVLLKLGQPAAAATRFEAALRVAPNDVTARQELENLQRKP